MKQNEFQELMARFGLRAGGDLALGAWKGWPVKENGNRFMVSATFRRSLPSPAGWTRSTPRPLPGR